MFARLLALLKGPAVLRAEEARRQVSTCGRCGSASCKCGAAAFELGWLLEAVYRHLHGYDGRSRASSNPELADAYGAVLRWFPPPWRCGSLSCFACYSGPQPSSPPSENLYPTEEN